MKLSHIAQALTLALVAVTAWLAYQAQEESARTTAKLDQFTQQQQKAVAAQAEASAALIPGLSTPLQSPSTAGSLPPLPQVPASTPAPVAPAPAAAPTTAAAKPSASPLDIVPPPLPGPMPAPGSAPKAAAPAPAPAAPVASTPAPAPSAPAATASPAAPPAASASTGTAGGPAPAIAPPPTAPLYTPLQRRIKDSPAVAKVKEAVGDQGFVTIDAGSKAGLKQGLKFDLRRDAAVVGRITISVVEEGEAVADLDPRSVPAGMTVQAGDELISVVLDR